MKKLIQIQTELKAPKNQRNNFGKYNYRSAEDILEATKPLLEKHECLLLITDEITETAGRIYVKATAHFTDGEDKVSVTAYAREEDTKKGMDASQITGAASSYARKYALNGLFLIDDTKDADATNKHDKEEQPEAPKKPEPKKLPELKESTNEYLSAIQWVKAGGTDEEREKLADKIGAKYTMSREIRTSVINAAKAIREAEAKKQKENAAINN